MMKVWFRFFSVFIASLSILLLGSVVRAAGSIPAARASTGQDYLQHESPSWEMMKDHKRIKGIYMTGYSVADKKKFERLLGIIERTELNAAVIDVKSDEGMLLYQTDLRNVKQSGANNKIVIKDIDSVLNTLNDKKIYPIARIVTFKDNKAASAFPNLAVKTTGGAIWRDRNGQAWLNPYNKDAWDYVLDVAEEAAAKGFKEIQFDYVRFPTDGNLDLISYGAAAGKSKPQAIADFLKYARKRLSNMGVVVSADIFGLVTTAEDDMKIGQQLEYLADSVDVLCPMVYPSHYGKGIYGVAEPDFEPYKIVNYSMKTAKQRLDSNKNNIAKLRPWLQDFTATYLPRYKNYGPAEIRAQINAAYDADVREWILWNAANKYTEGGLNKS